MYNFIDLSTQAESAMTHEQTDASTQKFINTSEYYEKRKIK